MNTYHDASYWCYRHRLSMHIGAYYHPSDRHPTCVYFSDRATRMIMAYV